MLSAEGGACGGSRAWLPCNTTCVSVRRCLSADKSLAAVLTVDSLEHALREAMTVGGSNGTGLSDMG